LLKLRVKVVTNAAGAIIIIIIIIIIITIHGQHHRKADVDRLYVPRKQGGRGLMQLEAAHAA